MTTPTRRWFRFSLRTLFVMVTLAAITFGWLVSQVQIVRERKAVLNEIDQLGYHNGYLTLEAGEEVGIVYGSQHELQYARVSFVRRLLGDKSYYDMYFKHRLDSELMSRLELAFPEPAIRFDISSFDNGVWVGSDNHYRDSLLKPRRAPNRGTIFKTGLIEK